MIDRQEAPIRLRTDPDPLHRRLSAANQREHFRANEFAFDRASGRSRGDDDKRQYRPEAASLGAKAPTEIATADADVLWRHAGGLSHRLARHKESLRRRIDLETIAVPADKCGMRFHRVVIVRGRRVLQIEAHWRASQSGLGIATQRERWAAGEGWSNDPLIKSVGDADARRHRFVPGAHKPGRYHRLFLRLRKHDRDRLPMKMNLVILKQAKIRYLTDDGRVANAENCGHARASARDTHID
jgi:hypothetical protein